MNRLHFSSLDDIERFEQRPLSSRAYPDTTWDLLQHACTRFADRPALTDVHDIQHPDIATTLSYRDFLTNLIAAANAFHQLGVGPSDVVATLMGASTDTVITLWAAEATGVVAPINPYLEPSAIARLIDLVRPKILVTNRALPGLDLESKIEQALQKTLHRPIIVTAGDDSPTLSDALRFNALLATGRAATLDFTRLRKGSDLAALFHTGGTTGVPKFVRHTHRNQAYASSLFADTLAWTENDCVLASLPLFHVNGVLLTGLSAFRAGAHVVLSGPVGFRDPMLPECLDAIVDRFGVTQMSAVPTIYANLASRQRSQGGVGSLQVGICGGAPLSAALARRVEGSLGLKLVEGYGLTETTICATINPPFGKRLPGSIGMRAPYLDVRVARLDAAGEIERFCDADEVGEIVVKGYSVTPGYLDERANLKAFTHDGYLKTGDLARQDRDGYFWIAGRSKDIIIRSGHNLDPSEIENALLQHEAVRDAAAVGQLDAYAGEVPVAFVALVGPGAATATELETFVRTRISERAALPRSIWVLDTLPVTAIGKIDKPLLRRLAAQEAIVQLIRANSLTADCEVLADEVHGQTARLKVSTETDAAVLRDALIGLNIKLSIEVHP